jgi:subtilisin family serine protease
MKIVPLTGIFFVLGCLLASSASPLVDSISVQDSEDVSKQTQPNLLISDPIDPALKHILSSTSEATILEVIIQFDDRTASSEKIEWLAEKGVTGLHLTKVVPSIFARGPASAIAELSSQPEILWVEWNAPLEQYMNNTVDVIKARNVWDREVLTKAGGKHPSHPTIKGDGVTVIVLDSGIDATHPDLDYNPQDPNNPSKPQAGDKVIYNAKLDQGSGSSTPAFAWIPLQNSDTSSGHGTHVAGTVAGNGDASAGDKLGVAPNAWLIGLSMGEAAFTIDEYSGLERTYELSEPGSDTQEAWNIKVVTNSWGPGFPFDSYDRNDVTVQIIEKLSYDNNVAVIFANGNDGGTGEDDRSNIFAKVPSAIGVAASNRNGIGMADFSSRGMESDITTWPDIAAPGVDIWSAAARTTMIGGGTGAGDTASGDLDYYYLAISGTSMATPHVAGLVALMFQAAPSLKMSDIDEDLSEEGDVELHDPSGLSPPVMAKRFIHEVELILKLTSKRITEGENLASSSLTGLDGKEFDFVQGYGLIDAQAAVELALKVEHLRDDDPVVSVWETYHDSTTILRDVVDVDDGDQLNAYWDGDFAVFSSGSSFPPASAHRKAVWIPAGTTRVTATLDYTPLPSSILCPTGANLRLALDSDNDETYESPDVSGDQIEFVGGTDEGAWWAYDVQGNAIGTCLTPNPSTIGPRSPYNIQVEVWLAPGDVSMNLNQSRDWSLSGAKTTTVSMDKIYFSHISSTSNANLEDSSSFFDWMATNWWLPTLLAIFFLAIMLGMNEQSRQAIQSWREKKKDVNPQIFEAAIVEATAPPPLLETSRTSLLDTASRMKAEVKDLVLDAELI